MVDWLVAHPDVLGIAVYIALSLVAWRLPADSPMGQELRRFLLDIGHKNLRAPPPKDGER